MLLCHENIFLPTNGPPTDLNFNSHYAAIPIMITNKLNNAVDCCKTVLLSQKMRFLYGFNEKGNSNNPIENSMLVPDENKYVQMNLIFIRKQHSIFYLSGLILTQLPDIRSSLQFHLLLTP